MKLRKLQKDKRGVLGMELAVAFVIAILVLIVIGILIVIVTNAMTDSAGRTTADTPEQIFNETITLTDAGNDTSAVQDDRTSIVLTSVTITNATNNTNPVLTVANFTIANGILTASSTSEFNGSLVNISAIINFDVPSIANNIGNNATSGVEEFFTNASTWFALLSVVVIILIVGVAIVVIRRFGKDGTADDGNTSGAFDV